MHIQGAAEDIGEPQHIVHLIRIVGAPGGHDEILARGVRYFRADLRIGVGECKHDRSARHGLHHLRCQDIRRRNADEYVGATHRIGKRTLVGHLRVAALVEIEISARCLDHALAVKQQDVVALRAKRDQQLDGGESRRPCTEQYYLRLGELLALEFKRVQQASANNDCRAVLVVMEDRNVEVSAQHLFDGEAVGRRNVFQIDATEGRGDVGHGFDKRLERRRVDLDIKNVDICKALEQHRLAFQHRLGGERPAIAKAENRRAITDDRHQISLVGVAVDGVGIARDFAYRLGDSW